MPQLRRIGLAILLVCLFVHAKRNPFPGEQWESGDIVLDAPGNTLFYYLFRARNPAAARTLVIWLNGGPGSSSALGMLLENGPYMFNASLGLERNPYSWNVFADLLFVDQPAGTGNSLLRDSKYVCTTEGCVGKNFYAFLTKFYAVHPEYDGVPMYITGESYCGHYIPGIAAYLVDTGNANINLKGIAIGNGMTDTTLQIRAAPTYLYANGIIGSLGSILAKAAVLACDVATVMKFYAVSDFCIDLDFVISRFFKVINVYDIRLNETYDKKDSAVEVFMHDPEIVEALGNTGRNFSISNRTVSRAMKRDGMVSLNPALIHVIDRGLNVLIYYGDQDYICNWMGGELMVDALAWGKKQEFAQKSYQDWKVEGKVVGKYKRVDNFAFMVIKGAGHMLPMDLPHESLEMLRSFVDWSL